MSERFDRLLSELCSNSNSSNNLRSRGENSYKEERLCIDMEDAYKAAADEADPPDLGLYLEYLISSLVAQNGKRCGGGSSCAETFAKFFKGVCAAMRGAQKSTGDSAAQAVRASVTARLLEIIRFEDYPAAAKRLAWVAARETMKCPELGGRSADAREALCEAAATSGLRSKFGAVRVAALRTLAVLVTQSPPLPERVVAAVCEGLEGILCGWGAKSERLAALELLATRTSSCGGNAALLDCCHNLWATVAERVTQDPDPEIRVRAYRVALRIASVLGVCDSGGNSDASGNSVARAELCMLVSRGLADSDPGVRAAFLEAVSQRLCGRKGSCAGTATATTARLTALCAALVPACAEGVCGDADVEDPLAEGLCCRLICGLLRSQSVMNSDTLQTFHATCGIFGGGDTTNNSKKESDHVMRCNSLVWRALVAETPQLEWPFTLGELAEALSSGNAGTTTQDPFVTRQLLQGTRGLTLQYDVAGSAALERVLIALLSSPRTSRSLIPHLLTTLRMVVPGCDDDDDDGGNNDDNDDSMRGGGRKAIYKAGVGILRSIQRLVSDQSVSTVVEIRARVSAERALYAKTLSAHLWDDGTCDLAAATVLTETRERDMELELLKCEGEAATTMEVTKKKEKKKENKGGADRWRRLDVFLRWIAVFRGFLTLFGVQLLEPTMIESCFTSTAFPALKAAAFEGLALLQLRKMNLVLVTSLFPKVLAHDPSPLVRATAAKALFDYAAAAPVHMHALRTVILTSINSAFSFDMAGKCDGTVKQRAQAEVYLAFIEGYAKIAASARDVDNDLCTTLVIAHAVSAAVNPAIAGRARGAVRAALHVLARTSQSNFRVLGGAALTAVLRVLGSPESSVVHSAVAALKDVVLLCMDVMGATKRAYGPRLMVSFRRHFVVDLLRHMWDNPLHSEEVRMLAPLVPLVVEVVGVDERSPLDRKQQCVHVAHVYRLCEKLVGVLKDQSAIKTLSEFMSSVEHILVIYKRDYEEEENEIKDNNEVKESKDKEEDEKESVNKTNKANKDNKDIINKDIIITPMKSNGFKGKKRIKEEEKNEEPKTISLPSPPPTLTPPQKKHKKNIKNTDWIKERLNALYKK